ncbi:MAG TPA: RHS repeat-associated core domain-containing protein [Mycobacteriales bacterium]|nr:RHS repeat-associated core domain-containing protein [Mycobacteriales bacterium]
MTRIVDALGRVTTATYNRLDEPLTVTDPTGVTTTNTYDAAGNLLSRSTPVDGTRTATTTYHRNDPDHPDDVTSVTDPRGNTTSYSYDSYGNLTLATDADGDIAARSYNVVGELTSSVSPRGEVDGADASDFTTTYAYDADGRLTATTDPLGRVSREAYDLDGDLVSSTDPDGHVTTYAYDADRERTKLTRADGTVASTAYDAGGLIEARTDASGATTSYAYDPLGRLVSASDPLGRVTSYRYDDAGNLTAMTDADGQTTTYGYDADNELVSVAYSDATTAAVGYAYDAAGRRVSMTDGTGTSHYSYNEAGWLTSLVDGAGETVGYGYDIDGEVTAITYPNGQVITRGYDPAGRMVTVTDWNGRATRFGYAADGDLRAIDYPNGVSEDTDYDRAGRTASIADTVGGSTLFADAYTRSPDGQLTASTVTGEVDQPDETYGYDSLNRLTSSSSGEYGYDAADNPTGLADGTTQTFDAADQLLTATAPGGPTVDYTSNARGDRTRESDGTTTTTYGYDQGNRLTSVDDGGPAGPATYTYNGDGLRAARTVGAATSAQVWDTVTGSTPLLLTDGATSYLYGPDDLPIEQIAGPTSITRVGAGSASGLWTSVTVTFPTAQAGDQILLAVDGVDGESPESSGYVKVGTFTTAGAQEQTTVFRRTATGGEHSATVTFGLIPIHTKTVIAAVYRGVDPTDPIDATTHAGVNGAKTVAAPSVDATAGEELVVADSEANSLLGGSWTTPTGMTLVSSPSTLLTASALADTPVAADGPTGEKTSTFSQSSQLQTVLLTLRPQPAVEFFGHDQLGSTRLLTNPQGHVDATYDYDPYGNLTTHTGTADTPLRWAGQYQDTTGLYYLRARYYDPATAQFLTRDPIEMISGRAYQYAGDDPLDAVDLTGLDSEDLATAREAAVTAGLIVTDTGVMMPDLPAGFIGLYQLDALVEHGQIGACQYGSQLGLILQRQAEVAAFAAFNQALNEQDQEAARGFGGIASALGGALKIVSIGVGFAAAYFPGPQKLLLAAAAGALAGAGTYLQTASLSDAEASAIVNTLGALVPDPPLRAAVYAGLLLTADSPAPA